MNRHAADILPIAAGLMDLSVPNAAVKPSHGQRCVSVLLMRWLLSSHQGSVSGKHLDYHLDE